MSVEENNPRNYEIYIQSSEWQKKSEEAKKRVFYRCQICNRHQDQVQLETHHRTYERLGVEIPEDLTVLCRDCHSLYSRYESLVKNNFFNPQKSRNAQSIGKVIEKYTQNPDFQLTENIPTGFIDFDKVTLGLRKSNLTLIAGQTGTGKTALALGIAVNAARVFNKKVVIFSLIHSTEQIIEKIIVQNKFSDGSQKEIDDLIHLKIEIDDTPALTPQNLRDKCFALYSTVGSDLVIIDGLEFMYSQNRAPGRKQELSEIAKEIKTLARELNISVLATTSEISSEQRTDKRPVLNDLQPSLEQAADVVIFPYRKSEYREFTDRNSSEDSKNQIYELIIAKNRNGSTAITDLLFVRDNVKFTNAASKVFSSKK